MLKLGRILGSNAQAIGHLHCLWWWAQEYAGPDGDLSNYDATDIAVASDWIGDDEHDDDWFREALIATGFIDRDGDKLSIHNWDIYGGQIQAQREKNRERVRRNAEKSRSLREDCALANAQLTGLDKSRQEKTFKPPLSPLKVLSPQLSTGLAGADAPTGKGKSVFLGDDEIAQDFELWWQLYGRVGTKADAERLYRHWRSRGVSADDLGLAAHAYRRHCESTDCKMKHASTFLAKPPRGQTQGRWQEWADGEPHGSMDVRGDDKLSAVLRAGAKTYGGDNGGDKPHAIRRADQTSRPAGLGADARRRVPQGELGPGD